LIASDTLNLLDRKSFGGNLAMKIDVKKAFDTLELNVCFFLLKVLKWFGFNEVFCNTLKLKILL